ncbi:hypothetical protein DMZ48_03705 [Robertkochia solimangrovi]|nr:hypothetical protein DMZ48_03705 [Robertkochia solimangrovi]
MRTFSQITSHLFNPLFMPLAGTVAYYLVSPKYNAPEVKKSIIFAILIVTIAIPILFFFLLKNLGWVSDSDLSKTKERRLPLLIFIILNYITIIKILPNSASSELNFFFVGIIGALIACLIMVFLKFKASMHMIGISGLTTFIFGLAVHYEINITLALAGLVLVSGAIATSRLYLKNHDGPEIIAGILLGALPQFITFTYWL